MGTLRKAGQLTKMRSRWDDVFKDDVWEFPPKPRRVRLWEDIFTVPMHYVQFLSKESGGMVGFYDLCLNWDYNKEEPYADGGCEACRLAYRASRYGYGYLLDRRDQSKNDENTVRPVRLAPKLIGDIVAASLHAYPEDDAGKRQLPKGWESDEPPDATDPLYGFDISMNVDSGSNKKSTEYKVHTAPSDVKPLTKEEISAFRAYAKKVTYQALVKAALITPEEQRRKYEELGVLPAEKKTDGKPSRKSRDGDNNGSGGGGRSADYRKYDTVPSDDDDDRGNSKTERRAVSSDDDDDDRKAKRRAASSDDDDDRGNKAKPKVNARRSSLLEDEDEAPRKPAALARPSSAASRPWDDDDDEVDAPAGRNYASASAREAPSDDDLD